MRINKNQLLLQLRCRSRSKRQSPWKSSFSGNIMGFNLEVYSGILLFYCYPSRNSIINMTRL